MARAPDFPVDNQVQFLQFRATTHSDSTALIWSGCVILLFIGLPPCQACVTGELSFMDIMIADDSIGMQ